MALEIYIPNTGQGDCTFIKFPNGKNVLVDFNRTDVDVDIIKLLEEKIPKKKHDDIGKTCRRINYFVITHPHDDHIEGIKSLDNDEFYIDEIWESGHRLYVPSDEKDDYKNYYDLLDLINKLKARSSTSVRVLKAGSEPFAQIGSTSIYVFSPSSYFSLSKSKTEIHEQCGILKIKYKDNSILLAGDSNRESWENRIVPYYSDEEESSNENLLDSTVLHASHHGSKRFFVSQDDDNDRYVRSIEKINPAFTVISVGSDNIHGHPHRIAMNIYNDKTKYNRVFTTKDSKSMYFAFKNDGKIEYKVGLNYNELTEIKHSYEDPTFVKSAATTLLFNIGKNIKELELPKRTPKGKREGYFQSRL